VSKPIPVKLVGDNWFNTGWISGILGLPKQEFMDMDNPIPDSDIEAWEEGYEMGRETPNNIREVFEKSIEQGHLRLL